MNIISNSLGWRYRIAVSAVGCIGDRVFIIVISRLYDDDVGTYNAVTGFGSVSTALGVDVVRTIAHRGGTRAVYT